MKNKYKYANYHGYSDITPYEIIRWVSEKTIEVRKMKAEPDGAFKPEWISGGFGGHCVNQSEQSYNYSSDKSYPVERIRLHKNGRWYRNGNLSHHLSEEPCKFYDYNF